MHVVAESLMYLPVQRCCLDIMPYTLPFLLDLTHLRRVRNISILLFRSYFSLSFIIAGYIALVLSL